MIKMLLSSSLPEDAFLRSVLASLTLISTRNAEATEAVQGLAIAISAHASLDIRQSPSEASCIRVWQRSALRKNRTGQKLFVTAEGYVLQRRSVSVRMATTGKSVRIVRVGTQGTEAPEPAMSKIASVPSRALKTLFATGLAGVLKRKEIRVTASAIPTGGRQARYATP